MLSGTLKKACLPSKADLALCRSTKQLQDRLEQQTNDLECLKHKQQLLLSHRAENEAMLHGFTQQVCDATEIRSELKKAHSNAMELLNHAKAKNDILRSKILALEQQHIK